jgi:integrase
MASIYARGGKLWCRLKDEAGAWVSKPSPYGIEDRRKAKRYADAAQRQIDERRASGAPAPTDTVRSYAKRWIDDRRHLDLDWKNDEGRLRIHVLPVIGNMKIADVRTRDIVELFRGIRTSSARSVAQRTVYNIYSVVAALFRDAKLADLISQSPCCLDERQLGPLRDKDPEWRAGAVFGRDEVERIISHPAIPADRQLVYALELLGGVRTGEAAALRWRHYDATTAPLGQLTVATSYNTRKHRAKGTKTEVVRHVPVHPVLAAMLAEWKLGGWAAMMGRAPEPDDLIVPLPPKHAARRRSRGGDAFRGHDYSGKRWREHDQPALGLRHRRHYDMRATFITLALEDGADPNVIETRVTHTKRSRSAFDGYNRGRQWEATCAEVAKLRITRRLATELATVIALSADGHEKNRGGGGSRTRVRKCADTRSYARSCWFRVSRRAASSSLPARRAS